MTPRTPRPEGWKGGSEDFAFLRTEDGRLGINVEMDDGEALFDRTNAWRGGA